MVEIQFQQSKNAERMKDESTVIEKLQIQKKRMVNYVDDINYLLKEIKALKEKRDQVFSIFDKELPQSVRDQRDLS